VTITVQSTGCGNSDACNFTEGDSCDIDCVFALFENDCNTGAVACGEGTVWDSETQECIVAYPSDSNFDSCVDLNDLMDLLSSYGICLVPEFTTCGDLIEYEGYSYSTVEIGDQCWFSENCRYLPTVSNADAWSYGSPIYYVYGYDGNDIDEAKLTEAYNTCGVLYNGAAMMLQEVCPNDWHVASDSDWTELTVYLGGDTLAVDKIKSSSGWFDDSNGSNSSGFTGKPCGFCDVGYIFNSPGAFYQLEEVAYWWTSTPMEGWRWRRTLRYNYVAISRSWYNRSDALSARCVRD